MVRGSKKNEGRSELKVKEDYIKVLWFSYEEGKDYVIGIITRKENNTYEYVYSWDIEDIIEKGSYIF